MIHGTKGSWVDDIVLPLWAKAKDCVARVFSRSEVIVYFVYPVVIAYKLEKIIKSVHSNTEQFHQKLAVLSCHSIL
jgi:hypothetical protein